MTNFLNRSRAKGVCALSALLRREVCACYSSTFLLLPAVGTWI